jgi:hypothetical protein
MKILIISQDHDDIWPSAIGNNWLLSKATDGGSQHTDKT